MKKIIVSSLMFMIILLGCINVFAVEEKSASADSEHYTIKLTANAKDLKPGEKLTVTLSAEDLKNVEDGINVFSGAIKFDSKFLKLDSVKEASGWGIIVFNEENNKFIAEKEDLTTTNQTLATFVFTVLETANVGDSANITLTEFCLSGDNDYEEDTNFPILTLTVPEPVQDNPNPGGNSQEDPPKKDDPLHISGEPDSSGSTQTGETPAQSADPTTSTGTIPQTGNNAYLICIGASVLLVVAGISIYKIKQFKGVK